VPKDELEKAIADGWQALTGKRKKTVRVAKPKKKADLLESRVWTVLWRMGFPYMSGKGGAWLPLSSGEDMSGHKGPGDQLDALAIDEEVIVCVECKSAESPRKNQTIPEVLTTQKALRKRLANAVARFLPIEGKRVVATILFTWDVILTENDMKRADEEGVVLFDERDLCYLEALVKHLGPAARYQFLAEVFRSKPISGLEMHVPALRAKMGGFTCYTFSIRPEYLLKIAYVAHRAKGKAADVDAYQRMIKQNRLREIAQYISDDGTFPTNIVINIERDRHVRFDRAKQEQDIEHAGATYGWLWLSPSYGSAWIIDGQHRLFAYSGHERAASSFVHVLAFVGLPPSRQAQLFVDINSEQKRVKRSLLVELAAELKWDSSEEDERKAAVISKAGMALDEHLDSPLQGRILLSDETRTDKRCISLTSLFTALDKSGFFVVKRTKEATEYGALWRNSNEDMLRRTVKVLKSWLRIIAEEAKEWWETGAAYGGGLAMNNGVTICINMLRSVLDHLGAANLRLLDDDELIERLAPFAKALGSYFARMSPEERREFRELQGAAGQDYGTRQCQAALQKEFPKFSPEGLRDWLEMRKHNTNEQARGLIEWIETTLQDTIVETLKQEYDGDDWQWWFEGVPKNVRKKVDERINESDGKAGGREQNFDLIHYREIIKHNWSLFNEIFGHGAGNKDKQTLWITEVSEMRNTVMHPSRREFLSFDKLNQLMTYQKWLSDRITAAR